MFKCLFFKQVHSLVLDPLCVAAQSEELLYRQQKFDSQKGTLEHTSGVFSGECYENTFWVHNGGSTKLCYRMRS
jgi:hypothetical protein